MGPQSVTATTETKRKRRVKKPVSVRLQGDHRYALDRRLRKITNELISAIEAQGRDVDATMLLRVRAVSRLLVRLEILDGQTQEGFAVSDEDLRHLTRLAETGLNKLGLTKRAPKAPSKAPPPLSALHQRHGAP
jgi:hypothetical protein